MRDLLQVFVEHIRRGKIEVDSEISLQHRLGSFLQERIEPWKVEFERSVKHFGLEPASFAKREIDLAILDAAGHPQSVVELKFPRNGRYPETMFDFCRDIQFIEQLKRAGFSNGLDRKSVV